jgi:hypothetical protein
LQKRAILTIGANIFCYLPLTTKKQKTLKGFFMKSILTAIALTVLASSSFASAGAIGSAEANAVLNKVGTGNVYKNGKAVFSAARACVLSQNDFETEVTSGEILVVMFDGRPTLANSYGIRPQGKGVGGKTFWEAGVIYDSNVAETRTQLDDGVRYEMCYGKNQGAFAAPCSPGNVVSKISIEITSKGVTLESQEGKTSYKSVCNY